jgi:hypothetical protein
LINKEIHCNITYKRRYTIGVTPFSNCEDRAEAKRFWKNSFPFCCLCQILKTP